MLRTKTKVELLEIKCDAATIRCAAREKGKQRKEKKRRKKVAVKNGRGRRLCRGCSFTSLLQEKEIERRQRPQ
jgi:hypothetical protein